MQKTILGQVLGQVLRPALNTEYLTAPGIGGGAGNPDAAILALFAAGEKGVWLDGSDLTTMFQDLAGTVPAAVDSPVGHWRDKSGNNAHWTANNSAGRPILRLVSGVYWLDFDGVDDRGTTVAIDFSATDEMTAITGLRKLSDAGVGYVYMLGPDISTSPGVALATPLYGPNFFTAARGSALSSINYSDASVAGAFSAVVVSRAKISTDTHALRINGVDRDTAAINQGAGNYANSALTIGSYTGGGTFFIGRLSQLILRGKTSTLAEYTAVEAWISAKIGSPF